MSRTEINHSQFKWLVNAQGMAMFYFLHDGWGISHCYRVDSCSTVIVDASDKSFDSWTRCYQISPRTEIGPLREVGESDCRLDDLYTLQKAGLPKAAILHEPRSRRDMIQQRWRDCLDVSEPEFSDFVPDEWWRKSYDLVRDRPLGEEPKEGFAKRLLSYVSKLTFSSSRSYRQVATEMT